MKIKKFWFQRGRLSFAPPLDPPLEICHVAVYCYLQEHVSSLLFLLLRFCQKLSKQTQGLHFNIILIVFFLTYVFQTINFRVCAFSSTFKIWTSSNPNVTSTVSVNNQIFLLNKKVLLRNRKSRTARDVTSLAPLCWGTHLSCLRGLGQTSPDSGYPCPRKGWYPLPG